MDMNNEMEELFRKAGEDYPLNLGKSDWDAVAGKLYAGTGGPAAGFAPATASRRARRRYEWLLLFLLPLFIYGLLNVVGRQKKTVAGGAVMVIRSKKIAESTAPVKIVPAGSINGRSMSARTTKAKKISDSNSSARSSLSSDSEATTPVSADNHLHTGRMMPSPAGTAGAYLHVSDSGSLAITPAEITINALKDKTAPVHPLVKQHRGFYAGVTAAPDLSSVKFQTMKSTGYSFSIVGGYRINSHLSIETGIGWDRKRYYSKGEYFDQTKTRIPSSIRVTYIDGYCDMFEIPLTIRYNLFTGKKGRWFAGAGFSSYLMKKEQYLYGAITNNMPWSRNVDYKNSGNDFFSVAQFSLGYEYALSARNGVRIEPYFKAPISGLGIGNLPITSVGITFGIIHSFR